MTTCSSARARVQLHGDHVRGYKTVKLHVYSREDGFSVAALLQGSTLMSLQLSTSHEFVTFTYTAVPKITHVVRVKKK
jgi:hypothetical protein